MFAESKQIANQKNAAIKIISKQEFAAETEGGSAKQDMIAEKISIYENLY